MMNFITFNAAYSLYPVAMFKEWNTLQVWRERLLHNHTVVDKYSKHGFQWFSTLPAIATVYNPIQSTLSQYNYSAGTIQQFELCWFMLYPGLRSHILSSDNLLEKDLERWP